MRETFPEQIQIYTAFPVSSYESSSGCQVSTTFFFFVFVFIVEEFEFDIHILRLDDSLDSPICTEESRF